MSESPSELIEILRRTSQGQGKFPELADALDRCESLLVVIPPADMIRFMGELDSALEQKGYGNVKVGDAEQPRGLGITAPDGKFVPQLFTDDTFAREYAVTSGLIEPDAALPMMTRTAADALFDCLGRGYAGIVIDDGTDHKVNLDRRSVARLYALVTLPELARLPSWRVMIRGGRPLLQKTKSGDGVQAFVFQSDELANMGFAGIRSHVPDAETRESEVAKTLEELLAAGVTALIVDVATPLERWYDRDDLLRMSSLLGGGQPTASAPAGQVEGAGGAGPVPDPGLDPDPGGASRTGAAVVTAMTPVQRARRYPSRPCVAPPGRGADESRATFQRLRAAVEAETLRIWEYIDALAFDLDLHVPIHPRRVDGVTWPQFFRHPEEEGKSIAYTFTREDTARAMIVPEPPEQLQLHHLSGIEVMRWVWNAPQAIDEVAIDLYKDTDGWARFPNFWALSAIYPQFLDLELDRVAEVGVARIHRLPGARGLKPEVVRALTRGWKQLVGLADDAPRLVEHRGRKFLPAFTDPDQFFLFTSQRPEFDGKPAPATEPPFGGWLRRAASCDGVLLDPAADAPLPLDLTDLLALDLWTRNGGKQPAGTAIVEEVARLRGEGAIDARAAGRIVADWPRYFLAVQNLPDGRVNFLKVPADDADWCAAFTSNSKAQGYVDVFKNLGFIAGDWQIVPVLHRWDVSVFHNAHDHFESGVWLDPGPLEGGGLPVDHEMLAVAVERIDERLKPRVPGFAPEG